MWPPHRVGPWSLQSDDTPFLYWGADQKVMGANKWLGCYKKKHCFYDYTKLLPRLPRGQGLVHLHTHHHTPSLHQSRAFRPTPTPTQALL